MKQKAFKIALTCSLVGLGIAGCSNSSDDPVQQVTAPIATPVAVSKVTIRLVNTDGEPVINTPVTFDDNDTGLLAKFAARSSVIAARGLVNKVTTSSSDDLGFVTVELAEGTTEGNLSLSVDNADYFPVTQIFNIGGETNVEVLKLTPKPAAGVTAAVVAENEEGESVEVISIVADQAFEEDKIVSVQNDEGIDIEVSGIVAEIETKSDNPDTGVKDVVAEVIIPATVAAETATGESASGALTITAAVYQNNTETSVDAFPGGLVLDGNLTNSTEAPEVPATGETDATDTTGFVTAGFIALEITDDQGNDITEFSGGNSGVDLDGDGELDKGILVATVVPKATIDPSTGLPVEIGSEIPVWSYDKDTAQWTFDGNAKIFEEADADNYRARFVAEHLSYWNLDFQVSYCRSFNTGQNALIEFLTAPGGARDTRNLIVSTFRAGLGYYATRTVNGDGYVRGYLPREALQLRVLDVNTFQEVEILSVNGNAFPSTGFNFCNLRSTGNDIVLAQPPQPTVTLNLRVEESCSDSSLDATRPPNPIPSTSVFLYNNDTPNQLLSQVFTNNSGEVSLTGLTPGTPYNLFVENRLAPIGAPFSDAYQNRSISSVAAAANPEVFDFEQDCIVTTGSAGGT